MGIGIKSIAGEESLGHSHNIHGGILWDAKLQQGIEGRSSSYWIQSFSRWLLAGLAEWQQRKSLELQSLS